MCIYMCRYIYMYMCMYMYTYMYFTCTYTCICTCICICICTCTYIWAGGCLVLNAGRGRMKQLWRWRDGPQCGSGGVLPKDAKVFAGMNKYCGCNKYRPHPFGLPGREGRDRLNWGACPSYHFGSSLLLHYPQHIFTPIG